MLSKLNAAVNIMFSKLFSIHRIIIIRNLIFQNTKTFLFNDTELEYFYHSYNNNRVSERAVEIPIIAYYLKKDKPSHILEIGNVTNHYYSHFSTLFKQKTVVDLYELGYDVINQDLLKFEPGSKFEYIISISTFEHFDSDRGRNREYVIDGSRYETYATDGIIHVCNELLAENGTFIFTAPIGYDQAFDDTVFGNEINNISLVKAKTIERNFVRKTGEIRWAQISETEAMNAQYNSPEKGVNVIVIYIIKN
ncbi:MAG: hypothetical protein HeimC2_18100 [Candidatus Heimdallarchaeota archaeon LC_2]|nr:MAG: hypothetical protein HeimC2_18100 [Candidatus Heimdallarchaeota archaeon LC_2]